ncbi:DcaP family trimeric outer membrane transporter [Acinetobacter bereziniae]|nr:DcaP family trimeric outer membrane transporter [Acinetobacter bereziniae]
MNPINLGGRAIAFSSLLIATHVAFASDITHLEQKILKLETSVEQIQNRTTEKIRSNDLNVKHKPDFDIQLYGSVRADFSYQTDGGDASRLYNQINTVPLEGSALSSDIFKSTLAASRLGMDIKSESNHVAGKLEFDF